VFTVADRERVRDRVLELAESDSRVVAGAIVGSLAVGRGDELSDLDLTFGVVDGTPIDSVLDDWTADMVERFDAVTLFDLVSGPSTYRVFLLPGWLQVDLSFTPAAQFRQTSLRFRLLFGSHKTELRPPEPARDLFGYSVLFARHAAVCIAREQWWQAEYWISAARDHALALACAGRGLPTAEGRGFDQLPPEVLESFDGTLARSLDRDELRRALARVAAALMRNAGDVRELADRVEPQLAELTGL
jgi:hypothetical protein